MRKLLTAQDGLNRSQQEAIARAMTRSITLWQARIRLLLVECMLGHAVLNPPRLVFGLVFSIHTHTGCGWRAPGLFPAGCCRQRVHWV